MGSSHSSNHSNVSSTNKEEKEYQKWVYPDGKVRYVFLTKKATIGGGLSTLPYEKQCLICPNKHNSATCPIHYYYKIVEIDDVTYKKKNFVRGKSLSQI